MMGTAEEGSCSMYFYESQTEVRIDFLQIDFSLLYTSFYRVGINNFNNENIRYFMIRAKGIANSKCVSNSTPLR